MARRVAAVGEPAVSVSLGDGGEGGPGGGAEVVVGAGLGAAEGLLDLGEGRLIAPNLMHGRSVARRKGDG